MKKYIPYITTALLTVFGLLTLFLSTSVIFDLFGIRAQEGNYVLFVVWANFISSIMYLFAAYGFVTEQRWTTKLLLLSVFLLLSALLGLWYHISTGGLYETKTIGALFFRISVTLVFAASAYFTLPKNEKT